jgi:hypothetical protein
MTVPETAESSDTRLWPLIRSELHAVGHGDGPVRVAGAALVVAGVLVFAVRRFRDGVIAPEVSFSLLASAMALGLPVVLLLLGPIRYLHRVESGVEMARRLAGIPAVSRRLAPLADCLWLLGSVLLAGLAAFVVGSAGAQGSGIAALPRLTGMLLDAALAGAALALLAIALACLARGSATYLLAAVAVVGVGLSLIWTAGLGGVFTVLDTVWPTRAIPRLINPEYAGDWVTAAILAATVSGLTAAVIGWAPETDTNGVRQVDGRTRARRLPRIPLWFAVAVCWGLVVPSLLAQYLPWYASPSWIAQVAAGRSSPDVAAQWVRAVQSGTTPPGTLAVAAPKALAGPLLPAVLRLKASTATVDYDADADPGTVTVEAVRGEAITSLIYICLEPRDATWVVTRVRSAPDCPRTRP